MTTRRAIGLLLKAYQKTNVNHAVQRRSASRGLPYNSGLPPVGTPFFEGPFRLECTSSSNRKLLHSTALLQAAHGPSTPTFCNQARRLSACSRPLSAAANEKENEAGSKGLARQEEPFDTITDRIPERPVSVVEGASYSIVIVAGLAAAGAAVYAVANELLLEPKEYKVFNKALDRVRHDSQVTLRTGLPLKGYGHESRNRAARQRISNRVWKDERGKEHIEVQFHIRGPEGAGIVRAEMFQDTDKQWKFTYLMVEITNPVPTTLLLESYIPAAA